MFLLKRKNYIFLLVILSISCFSISKSKSDAKYFKPNIEQKNENFINEKEKNIIQNSKIIYTFFPIEFPKDFNFEYKSILIREIYNIWENKNYTFKEYKNDKNFIQKDEIDLIIHTDIVLIDNIINIEQNIINQKENYSLEKIKFQIEIFENKKTSLFYKNKSDIKPIQNISNFNYKMLNIPSKERIKNIFENSKKQEFAIFSNSLDVKVKIDNKPIQNIPINSIYLTEGSHILEFYKFGFPTIKKKIFSKVGKKKIINQDWDNQFNNSAIRIISFPDKQKIILDNDIEAKTEYINLELKEGTHSLGIYKLNEEIKISEINFELKPNENIILIIPYELKKIFDPENEFWQDKSSSIILNDSLHFLNIKKINHEVFSNKIVPLNMEIESGFYFFDNMFRSEIVFTIFNDKDFLSLQAKEDQVYIYSNHKKNEDSFKYKEIFLKEYRPFKFILNKDSSTISIQLNGENSFSTKWNFNSLFQIKIEAKSDFDDEIYALKNLSIKQK